MQTKVQKWGNSLGLRIPRAFADEAGVQAGSEVDISVVEGNLVIKPARRIKYRLQDLLKGVTTKNLHSESDFGDPVGKEAW
jgi:antitoxin MazE